MAVAIEVSCGDGEAEPIVVLDGADARIIVDALADGTADRILTAGITATAGVAFFGVGEITGSLGEWEVFIGGALLTGGYGSVIGAAIGALIFGVVQQGLFFSGAESSLFRVFLGVILLAAVILNTYIRRMITGEK